MTFQVFAKENCVLCRKAQAVLAHLGVEPVVRYIDGPNSTPENVADLAWYDWTDKMPLIVVTEADKVVQRWNGSQVEGRFLPEVRDWLVTHSAPAR